MPAQFSYKNDSEEDTRVSPEETARQLAEREQQTGFDRDFDELTDPEHMEKDGTPGDTGSAGSSGKQPPDSTSKVRDAEDKGGNWKSNYGGNKTKAGKILTAKNVRAILKKRGPLGLIAILGLGGGLIGTALFSPGLILVQMKESLVDRANTQLASMDRRSTLIMKTKIAGATSGVCGAKITIKCKYATITNDQAERLKTNGVEVKGDPIGDNRVKPTHYTFNGEDLTPQQFNTKATAGVGADTKLQAALKKAYNPKYAGFADKIWSSVSARLGITKQRSLPDGDDAAKQKAMDDQVKNGSKLNILNDGVTCDPDSGVCKDKDGKQLSDAEKAARNKAIAAAGGEVADEAADEATKAAIAGVEEGAKTGVTSVANFVKVTGVADTACQAYASVRALGYAAKTVRAIQLARYAMIFVNTADQIKAGTAKPEDVAYLGGILTNVAYDVKSGVKRKAAMDSAGMKWSMFGDVSGFTAKGQGGAYISQFMAGGGLTGDLIAVTDYINQTLDPLGGAKTTCATLSNGWVQAGSVIAGIALMLVPGANVVIGVSDVVKGALNVAAGIGMAILPELLKSIVAGNVTKGIVGEDSGNAIASGFGVTGSSLAQAGANATMDPNDAAQYLTLNTSVSNDYSIAEAKTMSPLDPSNKNTFMGSIVNKLMPFISTTGSIGNPLSAFSSLASSSFASILPSASAITTAQEDASLQVCNDPDYKALNVATDPFCNLVFGIPPQYLNRDPGAVADSLEGQFDPDTQEPVTGSKYADYVTNCINRIEPIGSTGSDASGNDGSMCKINDENANYYLFYMDNRVETDMSGYSADGNSNTPADDTPVDTSTDPTNDSSAGNQSGTDSTVPSTETAVPQGVLMNSLMMINKPLATIPIIPSTKTIDSGFAILPRKYQVALV